MILDLRDQVAVVTGSTQGLGLEFARVLGGCGATVVLNGRRQDKLDEAVEILRLDGIEARGVCGDISTPGVIDELIEGALRTSGTLDVVVNNAAIARHSPIWDTSDDEWNEVMRINLTGVFLGVRAAARVMRQQSYGRIVNVTSSAGIDGSPIQAAYSAAKAGVIGLTKAAARQMAPYGVTVNAIAPAAATEMARPVLDDPVLRTQFESSIPMGRFADPAEVAKAILSFVGPLGTFTTGHVLLADGGKSM